MESPERDVALEVSEEGECSSGDEGTTLTEPLDDDEGTDGEDASDRIDPNKLFLLGLLIFANIACYNVLNRESICLHNFVKA